jgi:hypothetical protein
MRRRRLFVPDKIMDEIEAIVATICGPSDPPHIGPIALGLFKGVPGKKLSISGRIFF